MGIVKKIYGNSLKNILFIINPFKKLFIKTLCEVHMYINKQAIEILKNDGFYEVHEFFKPYLESINKGVFWADLDFKSREHFYNPYTHRGLFGCKNSRQDFRYYYGCALVYFDSGDKDMGMTYLGAALHLIQDSTIPQHANIKLLKDHRSFEQWIKAVHNNLKNYEAFDQGIYLDTPYAYIEKNARDAIRIYRRYSKIRNRKHRFYKIAGQIFPMAQRTTAGCLLNFYKAVND